MMPLSNQDRHTSKGMDFESFGLANEQHATVVKSIFQFFVNISLLVKCLYRLNIFKKKLFKESRATMHPFFEKATASTDGSIPAGLMLKIKDYSFESLVFAQLLSGLLQHPLTTKEKYHISLAGMLEALGDFICDDTLIADARILEILKNPEKIEPVNELEFFFIDIYISLITALDKNTGNLFYAAMIEGFEAQKRSRLLKTPGIDKNLVLQIQREVGGSGLWIFRTLIGKPIIENEKEVIYSLGILVQGLDDLFDLKWDFNGNIQTSATVHESWQSLSVQLNECFEKTVFDYKKMICDKGCLRDFLFTFFLFTLGGNSYMNNMNLLTKGVINAPTFAALDKKEIKFKYLTWKNFKYIIPRLRQFSKYA